MDPLIVTSCGSLQENQNPQYSILLTVLLNPCKDMDVLRVDQYLFHQGLNTIVGVQLNLVIHEYQNSCCCPSKNYENDCIEHKSKLEIR